ncbi:MAG: Stk1 family PASTA domain-containing Ser/Thr kinase, partial [Ruminococcaceae bacterium]|nr:Stk1 family PASTA domain-containing Ser/Thr kinase [Oscillospiraceae bacterium]
MTQFDKYIGMLIDDRYEIKEILGIGGMAVVFRAYDKRDERDIAIKILKEEALSDENAFECFDSESRAISMLSHPNIRKIYDISMTGEYKYLTMEYLDGPTLKSYVKSKGSLSHEEALDFITQILDALDHTHSKGIVHRDIKPQNVIVVSDNTIKLTDFGIAKQYDPHVTEPDDKGVGTVYYISPEQARGQNIDARGDIYSVGIMLYELICGKLPFTSDNPMEVAYMQINDEPQKPSEITALPKGLEQIILHAIEKDPDERFSDAGQMLAAVKRFRETPDAIFDFVSVPADSRFFKAAPQHKDDIIVVPSAGNQTDLIDKQNEDEILSKKKKYTPKKPKTEKIVTTVVETKPSKVSFISIIAGSLLACIIVAVMTVYYVYDNYIMESLSSSDSQLLVVEDFTNRIYDEEMLTQMKKLGYSVTVIKKQDQNYMVNTVISQSPEAGSKRVIIPGEKKCDITLYISSGESMTILPNYVGINHKDVIIDLNRIGFSYEIIREYNSAIPNGNVIYTFPKAGSYITSDTKITLYVSKGQELSYVTLPDLSGKNASAIHAILIENKLRLGEVTYEYSPTVPAGQVISQFPYFGSVVLSHVTEVSIVVSLGVDPSTILPDDPIVNPDDPNANPDDPNANPDDPNANPDDPNVTPDDPNANPDDPNANPDDPNANPDDPGTGTDPTPTP